MAKELYEYEVENVAGGQMKAENVMGVKGLTAETGCRTENNREGIFFKKNGIYMSKWEVIECLKKDGTRPLDPETESFIQSYIDSYNASECGAKLAD